MNKNMIEIERKFLVKTSAVDDLSNCYELVQGYLTKNDKGSVRVRIETEIGLPAKAFLMSKTRIDDMTNEETVDQISLDNAKLLIERFCFKIIRKTRCIRYVGGKKWEIDLFKEPNKGLVLAEIELESADEQFEMPDWVDKEVTGQPEYYNVNM